MKTMTCLCLRPRAALCLLLGLLLGPASASAASQPNAWQIADVSAVAGSGSLNYTNVLTPAQRQAATNNGWRLTVVSRLVEGSGGGNPAQFLLYGNGVRRFFVALDATPDGRLEATLGAGITTNLTAAGQATDDYHTHELQYDPGTRLATYSFDGARISTWAGASEAFHNGAVLWGSGSSSGRGRMNYHRVRFDVTGLGTVSEYYAGVYGNPVVAPDPATQGWTVSLPATTGAVTNFPVSPDTANAPGVDAYRLAVLAEPGLAGYYPFDGDVAPTVTDHRLPARNGTVAFSASIAGGDGSVGRAALAGGHAALGIVPEYQFASGVGTVEAYLHQTNTAGYNPCFFSCRSADGTTRYSLHGDSGGNALWVWNGAVAAAFPTPENMLNRRVHVAVVFTNQTVAVYYNGVGLGGAYVSLGVPNQPCQIGAVDPANREPWPGRVDEVAVYTNAQSAAAIAARAAHLMQPAVLTVSNADDAGPGSLRDAMASIAPGGTIQFAPGLWGRTIYLTAILSMERSMSIVGPGPAGLTLAGTGDSNDVRRVLYVRPGVTGLLAGLTITKGTAGGKGGGIYVEASSLTVSNCVLSGNWVRDHGGALYNDAGAVTVIDSSLVGNHAGGNGAGFYSAAGQMLIVNTTVAGNSAGGQGGGGLGARGAVTVQSCDIRGNTAQKGGGIYFEDVYPRGAIVQNSTIRDNSAVSGGGIYGSGTALTLLSSTLSGNAASMSGSSPNDQGGGGINLFQSYLSISNCTLSANAAFHGGAILAWDGGVGAHHCTLARNEGGDCGGIYGFGSGLSLSHNIFARGGSGPNLYIVHVDNGGLYNLGHNLSDDDSTQNQLGVFLAPNIGDLMLGSLADNGGPTRTHALLPGSPAINAGTNGAIAGLTYDQRGPGFPRLVGARVDVGALEASLFIESPIAGLPPVRLGASAWGDFDSDGRLDLLVTGYDETNGPVSQLWRNTAAGFSNVTAQLAPGLPGLYFGGVAWGDDNNDGRLDFLVTGIDVDGMGVSQLWRNTGSGFVRVTVPGLPGVSQGSVAWTDFDNDGRLDFILTGAATNGLVAQLWRNTGASFSNVTSQLAPGLPGVRRSAVAWGDYDSDGRMDLLFNGRRDDVLGDSITQLWRNTGRGFTNVPLPGVPGAAHGSIAWGDYDNDGRLDFLQTGVLVTNNAVNNALSVAQLWRNTGNGFVQVPIPGMPGVYAGTAEWGDFDNDGRRDIFLTGTASDGDPVYPSTVGTVAQFWRNTPAGFSNVTASMAPGMPGVHFSSTPFGDYNRDGRLDLLVTGALESFAPYSALWSSAVPVTNTPPTSPGLLPPVIHSLDSVTLRWTRATDAQSPPAALSYNLVLGTGPLSADLAPSQADMGTGFRRVVQLGPVNGGASEILSYTFTNLPAAAQYFWSVQAIDTAFAGGPFAPSATLVLQRTNITVTTTNDNGPGSLREALAGIAPGGVIMFAPALAGRTIVLRDGPLLNDHDARIVGPAAGRVTLRGLENEVILSGNGSVANLTFTGGGLAIYSWGITVSNCVITGNGAGLVLEGDSLIENTTIHGNSGPGLQNRAGLAGSRVIVRGCTISDNAGVGLVNSAISDFLVESAAVGITNCTISGNAGGGLVNSGEAILPGTETPTGGQAVFAIAHTTFHGNRGFAISNDNHLVVTHFPDGRPDLVRDSTRGAVTHTLFAAGSRVLRPAGGVIDATFCLADKDSLPNLVAASGDLKLGPLANNGGPTRTHALQSGSPALNSGAVGPLAGLPYDQRGPAFARRFGTRLDIGAYELQTGFTDATKSAAGMQLQFQGTPNSLVRIEWNIDARPTGWQILLNSTTDADGNLTYTDPAALTAPRRLYRARRD